MLYWNKEDIFLDQQSCIRTGLYPAEVPKISVSNRQYRETDIPGRDGIFYEDLETYEDLTQTIKFNFRARKGHTVDETFRSFRRMIRKSKTLAKQSDNTVFYKIKKVSIGELDRGTSYTIGTFDVEFTLDPYAYLRSGSYPLALDRVKDNKYDLCKPIYILNGEGNCDLTVNGKVMKCNVSDNLYIDTDLMLAYRKDGNIVNSEISGNYEDLWLEHGMNSITVSNSSIKLTVIPNWRYEP